jgi:deazaflavin-dependent oxidoreductase (nitroreductase family)
MSGNDFVKFFLRTPLHKFMGNTMLLTVTGHKTGRKYTTPVNYYREDGCLWVMTNRDRSWWRNLRNGAQVSLLIHGKTMDARAQVEGEIPVEKNLAEYIRHIPVTARSLGIRMEKNAPNADDLSRLAKVRLFVKIEPFYN